MFREMVSAKLSSRLGKVSSGRLEEPDRGRSHRSSPPATGPAGRKINTNSNLFKCLSNHMTEKKEARVKLDKSSPTWVHYLLFLLLIDCLGLKKRSSLVAKCQLFPKKEAWFKLSANHAVLFGALAIVVIGRVTDLVVRSVDFGLDQDADQVLSKEGWEWIWKKTSQKFKQQEKVIFAFD